MSSATTRREQVQAALKTFADTSVHKAATNLLNVLGYTSEKTADLGNSAEALLANIEQFKPELGNINRDKIKADRWKSCAFLFQLTNDEIPSLLLPSPAGGRGAGGEGIARSLIESFVFLAIELQGESWSRTDLAAIARELNRRFPMPAIVIFKHGLPSPAGGGGAGGEGISLVVIDRRANLKDAAKDVIDSRITVIKDVRINNTHHAHLDILADIALENLGEKRRPTNFRELYDAWIEALSTQALNKRFYQELANWYFWALTQAEFPKDAPKDADGRDSLSLIRLITRIIFCWFLKEKGLLPNALFDQRIATLLGDYNPTESTYYKAILQNLFFATLNQEMDKRVFRKAGQNFMAHNLYRYRSLMKNPDEVLKLLAGIPFMNGGLFECLDKTLGTREKPTYVRIDGFSDRDDNPLKIPNELFFGDECIVDLSGAYGDNKFKSAKVAGLIHILDRYKFTVAENTPIEEEVALDPELLGKVFENLLAAYNPETGATARKQTGSFYTPREIVNYMVDESLIASLKTKLEAAHLLPSPACGRGAGGEGMSNARPVNEVLNLGTGSGELDLAPVASPLPNPLPQAGEGANESLRDGHVNSETRLRHLFAYNDQQHQFSVAEVETLIEAIDHLKILDPACGSGAFPMGVLHKLVFVLGKLDPGNRFWKARQLAKASEIPDATVRERVMDDIEQTFGANELDYGRKLYLIENCIYGVDIQPIAVQISKLRFFISLVVEQNINPQVDNLGIRPLPNLETKFVAANTLIGINRPGQQLLRNLDIDVKEAELRRVRERHFLARTPTTKAKCRELDATLRAEIAELLKSDGWNTATACALAEWNPYDQNASAGFFDTEWMFGLTTGFDIAIGNPPYGSSFSDEQKQMFLRLFHHQDYQLDSYLLFLERGFDFLRQSGVLAFIIPNPWLSNLKLKKIRRFIFCDQVVQEIVHYSRKVFDAIVDTEVVILRKEQPCRTTTATIIVADLDSIRSRRVAQSKWAALKGEPINIFADTALENLVMKMQIDSCQLKELCNCTVGMKPYQVGKGIPKQTRDIVEERVFDATHRKDDSYRPLLRGRDIERYITKWDGNRWIKYGVHLAEPRPSGGFDAFKKIVIRQTGDSLIATLDTEQFVCMNNMHTITPKDGNSDLLFILGLLNSKLLNHYFQWMNPEKGEALAEVKKEHVEKLVIKKATSQQAAEISNRVEKVLSSKKAHRAADTSALEREIDQLVYLLYGLTPEEIKIVEKSAPSSSPRKQTTQEVESEP